MLALADLTGKRPATGRQAAGNVASPAGAARSAGGNAGNVAAGNDAGGSVDPLPAVAEAARAQLEAIRDEWLRPLIERNEALAVEVGALRERAGHQAGTIDRLERERDALRDEVERLRSAADAARTPPEPPGAAERPGPAWHTPVARWRRLLRRLAGDGG